MKLNQSYLKPKWVEFEESKGVSFKIIPFPESHNVILSFDNIDSIEIKFKMFDYCVVDWKGVNGEDDKPLECNSENKRDIFTNSKDVMIFIINKSFENQDKIIEKKT